MRASRIALIVGVLIATLTALPVAADELTGSVVEVAGTSVIIELSSGLLPQVGDLVSIQQQVPGVGAVALKGQWEIVDVSETTADASANGEVVKPQVGQTAVITTTDPRSSDQVALDRRLLDAADNDDSGQARAALEAGANLDVRGTGGSTPLMRAAGVGNTEVLRVLLDAGADMAMEARRGQTALGVAASTGHVESIALLLEAGAQVDAPITRPRAGEPLLGATALVLAARNNRGEAIRALLSAGANPEAVTHSGETPLLMAVENSGTGDSVRQLLGAGADPHRPRSDGASPLMIAAANDAAITVRILIEAGATVEARLAGDAPTPYLGMTPLLAAAQTGSAEAVAVLIAAGADPGAVNSEGKNAMALARDDEHDEVLAVLQDPAAAMADLMQEWIEDLSSAADDGEAREVETLLAAGVDPNVRDEEGVPPLLLAVQLRDPEDGDALAVIRALLAAGADVNGRDEEVGATPLIIAAANGRRDIIGLLLQQGADVNAQARGDSDGEGKGFTALMLAAMEGNEDAVIGLLGAGADPSMTEANGQTAADVARQAGEASIVRILESVSS